jgi:hypothetical protein
VPLERPSRPSFDTNSDVITEAPQDYHTAKNQVNEVHRLMITQIERALSQALKRDGYKCVLSGKLDATIFSDHKKRIDRAAIASTRARNAATAVAAAPSDSELANKAATFDKELCEFNTAAQCSAAFLYGFPDPPIVTDAAHIFPESTNKDLGNHKKVRSFRLYVPSLICYVCQMDCASSLWAAMERLGQRGFRDELDGSKIHPLGNIMTLHHDLHTHFNRLALWLEADDVSRDER